MQPEELSPEERAKIERTAFGRGLLRIREEGDEEFAHRHRFGIGVSGLLGGCATYLAAIRLIPLPVVRHIIGLAVALLSVGMWWFLYGLGAVVAKGWSRRG